MHGLLRQLDGVAFTIEQVRSWPGSMRAIVNLVLDCASPMCLAWGPDLRLIYNDAFIAVAGERHPAAFGGRMQDVFAECWPAWGPLVQRTLEGASCSIDRSAVDCGAGISNSSPLKVTFSCSPVRGDDGAVAGILWIAPDTTRPGAGEGAHGQAAFQTFQLELSDALQALTDGDEIIAVASGLLGQHLGMTRVIYAHADDAKGTFAIRQEWTAPGVASIAGRINSQSDFGSEITFGLRAGQTVAVDDVTSDERTAAHAAIYADLGARSFLAVPLMASGQLSVVLVLQHHAPFQWKQVDIRRAREVAQRTWAHLETALARAALRAEQDQSRHILESMSEGFAMLDADFRLVRMNAAGRRLGEISEPDVIGREMGEIWPAAQDLHWDDFYRHVVESAAGGSVEFQQILPGNRLRWLELRAYPLLDGGLALFYRDIDERKQIEVMLKETDRRKDEFLATLAHELRNPLAPIVAAAQLLSHVGLPAKDVKHSSEVIARQVGHLTSLVDDLLDMSRVKNGLVAIERMPLDVNDILADALEQAEPLMKSREHRISVHAAPAPAWVLGDRTRLVQVAANLLNNAAKYTPVGGEVSLRVDMQEAHVSLTVRDNGIGMSADFIKRAFVLFAQWERSRDRAAGGLGVGLALVKSLVELHGGSVTAHSEGLGCGTELVVLLPRHGDSGAGGGSSVKRPGRS